MEEDAVLLDVQGVVYRVYAAQSTLARLPASGEVFLSTRLILREDDVSLYGFLQPDEERLFGLLLGVGGVGPKVALALLSRLGAGEIALAIAVGDERRLTQAAGVGKKLAARIVLELRDRLRPETEARSVGAAGEDEALLALLTLGVPERAARAALEGLEGGVEERVRQSLARIGAAKA